jgi:hypothetical protein
VHVPPAEGKLLNGVTTHCGLLGSSGSQFDNAEFATAGSPHHKARGLVFDELKQVQNIEPNPRLGAVDSATNPNGRIV